MDEPFQATAPGQAGHRETVAEPAVGHKAHKVEGTAILLNIDGAQEQGFESFISLQSSQDLVHNPACSYIEMPT